MSAYMVSKCAQKCLTQKKCSVQFVVCTAERSRFFLYLIIRFEVQVSFSFLISPNCTDLLSLVIFKVLLPLLFVCLSLTLSSWADRILDPCCASASADYQSCPWGLPYPSIFFSIPPILCVRPRRVCFFYKNGLIVIVENKFRENFS